MIFDAQLAPHMRVCVLGCVSAPSLRRYMSNWCAFSLCEKRDTLEQLQIRVSHVPSTGMLTQLELASCARFACPGTCAQNHLMSRLWLALSTQEVPCRKPDMV